MKKSIQNFRQEIDLIDSQIIQLLMNRFLMVDEIKQIKRAEKLPIEDKLREEEIFNRISCVNLDNQKINKDIIENIYNVYRTILSEGKKRQLP